MKKLIAAACLLLLSSCFFIGPRPTKRLRRVAEIKPLQVAIVPGLPLINGQWDTLLKARVLWSEFLVKKGYVDHVMYSGAAVYSPWIEGSSMALYAKALGVDSTKILVDTMAEHSTENLYYGYLLARQKGFTKIAIATDPVQCAFLHRFARKNFPDEITFLPIVYDSIRARTGFECLIDTALTRKKGFVSIREKQNYKDRLKGSRGKNIPK